MPERRKFVNFDIERKAYEGFKSDFLDVYPGQYVVFVGKEWIGPFADPTSAMKSGYGTWGMGPLYVKHVIPVDRTEETSRTAEELGDR